MVWGAWHHFNLPVPQKGHISQIDSINTETKPFAYWSVDNIQIQYSDVKNNTGNHFKYIT